MARRGRKPKPGKRYKCGKLMLNQTPEQIAALRLVLASQMPHRTAEVVYLSERRKVPVHKLSDDRAEHPLGRYLLVGAISAAQYEAGCRFRDCVNQYRRVLDLKKQDQSIAGFAQPQGPMPRELDDDKAVKILREYMSAFEAIGGRAAQAAIKRVVILEKELDAGLFPFLNFGLLKLVGHFGLTN